MIQTRALFELRLTVPQIDDLGPTPNGHRKIATVTGTRRQSYRQMVEACRSAILRGDAYQLCLTNEIDPINTNNFGAQGFPLLLCLFFRNNS